MTIVFKNLTEEMEEKKLKKKNKWISPERVKLEKSFSKRLPEAWKNSQKSAVVGGGDGESKVKEQGDCKQLDEAGLKLEQGVPTSMYLQRKVKKTTT